jgi:hypothetical protein
VVKLGEIFHRHGFAFGIERAGGLVEDDMTRGLRKNARATEMRCFCPLDRLTALSFKSVS